MNISKFKSFACGILPIAFTLLISVQSGAQSGVQDALAGISAGKDTTSTAKALANIRQNALAPIRRALQEGATAALARGDSSTARWFLMQDDRYALLTRGTVLPWFLREPPPLIKAVTGTKLRAFVVGDWGSEKEPQRQVAAAVKAAHEKLPFNIGLTVGDNFYPTGINNPKSPRWQTSYENNYGTMGVPVFASLGNHDYLYDGESAAAEIVYTTHSKTWRLPAEFYTYVAGPVQFFVINTNQMSDYHLRWLSSALAGSTAAWKVVYGHHPLYTGPKTYGLDSLMSAKLVGLMQRYGARVYLAGHHHSLQHTVPVNGIEQFIIGGGGASTYKLDNQDQPARFAKSGYGFGTVEADAKSLTVRFIDTTGTEIYSYTIR